ncbi:MAG TPA: hypothetical protein VGK73_27525 [Polyangiaceae bacterium]
MRSIALIGTVLSFALALGCNTARDQQKKADEAQVEANDKIAEANREADQKIGEAQAEADKKTADAQATFAKIREDYRHEVSTKLADLDKEIAELEAEAKTAKPQKRPALDAKLADIHATRDMVAKEFQAIDSATALTWDEYKKRMDKALSDLEAKVDRTHA